MPLQIPSRFPFLQRFSRGALALLFFAPLAGFTADDEKPRAKKKPIKLAAAKVRPGDETVTSPAVDLTSLPVLDIDPDLPDHLQPVRLYNRDGRHLDARVIAASSEAVTVQRLSDLQTFDVPLNSLDASSVQAVEAWVDRGTDGSAFALDFEVSKRMVESDSFSVSGREFKKIKWAYDVVMTNQSRNELNEAKLEYQIVYDDEVQILRTSAYPGKGQNMRDGRDIDLPALAYNGRAEFTTPPVELQTYEYKPTRGEREFRRDEIIGIWIRVVRDGEVISEHLSHPAAMEDLPWDAEEEIEIIVRDSFQDQFDD